MEAELVAHTPDPAWVIEQAASVCYDSIPTRECKLVMQCYRSGHHSVLEHASFTFKISGISRACSHQLVRHRMASYSQRSQRYCGEDGFGYVTPPSIELSSYHDSIENALDEYVHLKNSMGRPAEDARYVLPNACHYDLCDNESEKLDQLHARTSLQSCAVGNQRSSKRNAQACC